MHFSREDAPVSRTPSVKRRIGEAQDLAFAIVSKEASRFDSHTASNIRIQLSQWFDTTNKRRAIRGMSLSEEATRYARRVFVLAADVFGLKNHFSYLKWYLPIHHSSETRRKLGNYTKEQLESNLIDATDLAFKILEERYSSNKGMESLLYFYFEPDEDNRGDVSKYTLADDDIKQVRKVFWIATMVYETGGLFRRYKWYGDLSKDSKLAAEMRKYRRRITVEIRK